MLSCPGVAGALERLGGKGVVQVARHLAAREDTTRALPLDAREQHHSLKASNAHTTHRRLLNSCQVFVYYGLQVFAVLTASEL